MALGDASDTGHDLPGGAIAALEGIALNESGLQRMKLLALRETFNRFDIPSLDQCGERQARLHALAIQEHRAGAALTEAATLLRAGKVQVLPQSIEERRARIERQAVLL